VINLKTAKMLGLTVPVTLQVAAARLIECPERARLLSVDDRTLVGPSNIIPMRTSWRTSLPKTRPMPILSGFCAGGAEGGRTPDLFIAK
jgi:hypothetical protein